MSILLIDLYRFLFSSLFAGHSGSHCRFSPTCSRYAREALELHGFRKGIFLTFNRLVRCHPWSGVYGQDPVDRRS